MGRYHRRSANHTPVDFLDSRRLPLATWWFSKSTPEQRHSPYLGVGSGGMFHFGAPYTHLLCLGPPQGTPGKSAASAAPNAILHHGPVAMATTKWDLPSCTAMARYCVAGGEALWAYNPTGPVDEGFREVRWSPLTYCTTDAATDDMVQTLIESTAARNRLTAVVNGQGGTAEHFIEMSRPVSSGLLRYCNGTGQDMRWAAGVLQLKNHKALVVVADWLREHGSRYWEAVAGCADPGQGGREIHSVLTTAQIMFEPWTTDEALVSMTDPNFDVEEYVLGDWDTVNEWLVDPDIHDDPTHPGYVLGRAGIFPKTSKFQTVVTCINREKQLLAAPLVMAFFRAITRAAMARASRDAREGIHGRPNVGLVLDELANLAPLPNLPDLLSEGASQGVTVYGYLQTARQSLHRWGDDEGGYAMMSNFRNVIGMPGITDLYSLEWFQKLGGQVDRTVITQGTDGNGDITHNRSFDRIDRFTLDALREGHPQNPDLAMMATGHAMSWGYCTPVYRARPWVELLLRTLEYLTFDDDLSDRPEQVLMPAPPLDRDGTGRFLTADQHQRYRAAMDARNAERARLGQVVRP